MRINDILSEAPAVGSGPSAAMARGSEEVRADLEFATLKKFSPKFANEFKQKFQLLGKSSVDAAYQAAAEANPAFGLSVADAKGLASAEHGSSEYNSRMNAFISAMPDRLKSSKKQFRKIDTPALSKAASKGRGWDDSTHGHLRKGTKDFLDKMKVAGQDKMADVKGGWDIGAKLGTFLSKPVGVSRVKRN